MRKKVIRTTITLVNDRFADGTNRIVAENLRTSCSVQFGGGAIVPTADIAIYGLNMQAMNKLMRIRWQDIQSLQNIVRIDAGEEGSELTLVYEGQITFGYIDMSSAPDAAFRIRSTAAAYDMFNPASPITYAGPTSVVQAIAGLCAKMGRLFENSGVPASLMMEDVTLVDTDMNKVRKLCKDYQIDLYVEQNVITIAPRGAPRIMRVPVLTPKTGLIGYPIPTMQGIELQCLYDPFVRFGGLVRIRDSLLETANGEWRVFGVTIDLESIIPGGKWFMNVKASRNEPSNVAISR